MFNLLPSEHIHDLQKLYRQRIGALALIAALCCASLVFVALVPSLIVIRQNRALLQNSIDATVAQTQTSFADVTADVTYAQNTLKIFLGTSTPETLSTQVRLITAQKPAGVTIGAITLVADIDTAQTVARMTGNATTRESLRAFETALETIPGVRSVNIPVSVFAKAKDIDFTVEILLP